MSKIQTNSGLLTLSTRDLGIEAGNDELRRWGWIKLEPEEYEVFSTIACFDGKSPSLKESIWIRPDRTKILFIRDSTGRAKGHNQLYLRYPECYDFQGPNDYYKFAENTAGIPYIRLMKATEALAYAERIKERYLTRKNKPKPVEGKLWVVFQGDYAEIGMDERARKLWEEMVGPQ